MPLVDSWAFCSKWPETKTHTHKNTHKSQIKDSTHHEADMQNVGVLGSGNPFFFLPLLTFFSIYHWRYQSMGPQKSTWLSNTLAHLHKNAAMRRHGRLEHLNL